MEFAQWLALGALVTGLLGGLYTVINTIITRKSVTPELRQTELEFGVGLLKSQIDKAERAEERWVEIETFLRDELRKKDADTERLNGLLSTANAQIADLISERNELRNKLTNLASKARRGERITLSDITDTAVLEVISEDQM